MGRKALSDVDSNGRDLDADADEISGQSVSARVSTGGGGQDRSRTLLSTVGKTPTWSSG